MELYDEAGRPDGTYPHTAMIKGIIFDMDGVLIDSEGLTAEAAVRMFAEKGVAVKKEDFTPFLGMGEKEYLGGVAKKYQVPFDLERDRIRTYEIYAAIAGDQLFPLPGVMEWIEYFRREGYLLAVGTSAHPLKMHINLGAIGLDASVFHAIVSGEDVKNNKPHPEIFLTAVSRLGLNPSQCVVIEDSPAGVAAAKKAGCKCIAVLTTHHEKELNGADRMIPSLENVFPEIVTEL